MSDIIDKVAKLMRLSKNESASPAEAANAAAAAQELMLRHKIDEADVSAHGNKTESPVDWFLDAPVCQAGRLLVWRGRLADGVAEACLCRAIVCHGFDAKGKAVVKVTLVGKRDDAEVVRYLYVYLCRQIEQLTKAYLRSIHLELHALRRVTKAKFARVYANNFRLGAVQQIVLRLMEKKRAVVEAPSASHALVLLRTQEEEVERVTNLHSKGTVRATPTLYVPEARAAGMQAGQNVPLTDALHEAGKQPKGTLAQ